MAAIEMKVEDALGSKSSLRTETTETKLEDDTGSKPSLRLEMTEIDIEDAVLDISSSWRRMVDNNLPEIVQVLQAGTTKDASFFTIVLLNDQMVVRYLADLLDLNSTARLQNLLVGHRENREHRFRNYFDIRNIDPDIMQHIYTFYMGSFNFEDETIFYLDTMMPRLSNTELKNVHMNIAQLLAGAYYGGHDNLIAIIKAKIAGHRYENVFLYIGMVGAACAGRYHYFHPRFNPVIRVLIRELSEKDLEAVLGYGSYLVEYHFILSRDNVTTALTAIPMLRQGSYVDKIIERIVKRGRGEFLFWFMTSDLARGMGFKNMSSRRPWEIVRICRRHINLSPEVMTFLNSLSDDDLQMYVAIRIGDLDKVKKLLELGYKSFFFAMEWAITFNNYEAFELMLKAARILRRDKRLRYIPELKAAFDTAIKKGYLDPVFHRHFGYMCEPNEDEDQD